MNYLSLCSTLLLLLASTVCTDPLAAQTPAQKAAASAFVDAFAARNWDALRAIAHPDFQQKVTVEQLEKLLDDMESRAGKLQRHSFYSGEFNRSYANVVHRLHFKKDSIGLRIVVDSLNFVGGMWIEPIQKVYAFAPPPYADSTRFFEETISFGGEQALPGVITVPKGKGPFPAVVLVHGSGPQDRDQTVNGNKMFRDLAWGLASKGIMVLRYDKRTRVHGPKMNLLKLTVQEESIDDAVEGLRLLRGHSAADTNRLILLGHSLGAALAPEIATQSGVTKGVVMLAPIARPLEVVISDQLRYIASQQDTLTEQESVKLHTELQKAAQIADESLGASRLLLGVPASYYYDMHKRDQKAYARALGVPIFIARGEKDYQAPQMEYVLWQDYLKDIPKVTFKTYRNCYHPFIETDAKPGPWNYTMEGHVTEELINDLVRWCTSFSLDAADATQEKEYRVR
ncbi:MAG: alpha/beta fold hydrolase [Bacteroidia bacterium]|nr:alpha/beta fold hydrolase [Bacteroidia bacterium]